MAAGSTASPPDLQVRADHNEKLEAEIARLDDLGLDELRALWSRFLGKVPAHYGASLLRRRLGYELQARAHGDLPAETRRRLKRLHHAFKADAAYAPSPSPGLKPGTNTDPDLAQRGAPRVEAGFEYRGERFRSLSEIARRITGTRWSGPLFFALKHVAP